METIPAHPWPEDPEILHLARRADCCTVLGPGVRAVLWVQGCPFRCPGCVAPETLPFEGGFAVRVDALTRELIALPKIEGVTLSGGEPMAQAAALCALIDRVRAGRDLSFLAYTGFTLEQLWEAGTPAQRALLERLDILIDGPYLRARHTDLRWRGSDNQRVHLLSGHYQHLVPRMDDRGRWIEFELGADGSLHWMGIPPPGFQEALVEGLGRLGIEVAERGPGQWAPEEGNSGMVHFPAELTLHFLKGPENPKANFSPIFRGISRPIFPIG